MINSDQRNLPSATFMSSPQRINHRREHYPTRSALRWLFIFRLLMVGGLLFAFSPFATDPSTANSNPQLAWWILIIYALLVLSSGFNFIFNYLNRSSQVQLAIFIDILSYTMLMHAAGGITSGLGTLLAVAVASGALLLEGRLSLLFAALASLAVIAQQVYSSFISEHLAVSFTQAGLLGILFFTVALLAHVLYRRVRSAEDLAARRKIDLDDLAKLNELIIQSSDTGILVIDGERRVRLSNQAALNLLNIQQVRPGSALATLAPALDIWLAQQFQTSRLQNNPVQNAGRSLRPTLKPLGNQRSGGAILYLRDDHEITQEAQQVKLASLGTLTASIAHNIRNPLNAISQASQLLAENLELAADDQHLVAIVRRNSARIEEIVQSVLQLSRREPLQSCKIELSNWLNRFYQEFCEHHQFTDQNLCLQSDVTLKTIEVEVDPRHLQQILNNLCENALLHGKISDHPTQVILRLTRPGSTNDTVIEVSDDGPGIPLANVRHIFEPFYTTTAKGTGLGLYIARELAETNGIRLWYEPQAPHGSCFRLVFAA